MPYTLTIGFIWFALAAMIGLVVGWVLRSAPASRQVSRARKKVQHELDAEITELRTQVTTLQGVAEERDRLQSELESMRELHHASESEPKSEGKLETDESKLVEVDLAIVSDDQVDETDSVERDDKLSHTLPDVELGAAVLGRRLVHDDLKAVVGIGPAIERLCHEAKILTWLDLAGAEPEALKSMLSDAGARFGRHDPLTWPEQARRFAEGRWEEARAFEEALVADRNQ